MVRKRNTNAPAPVPQERPDLSLAGAKIQTPSTWRMSPQSLESMRLFIAQSKTRHGMYASVPMVCKGTSCPYAHVCIAVEHGTPPIGERCTREIAAIIEKVDKYCDELEIDDTKYVNLSLIKELVDAEIMIMRCDSILSVDGELVEDIVVSVSDRGEEITQPAIKKAVDLKERWIKIRHNVLNQLNSTPKDKAKQEASTSIDPSKYAAKLMKVLEEEERDKELVIEAETSEIDPT